MTKLILTYTRFYIHFTNFLTMTIANIPMKQLFTKGY